MQGIVSGTASCVCLGNLNGHEVSLIDVPEDLDFTTVSGHRS